MTKFKHAMLGTLLVTGLAALGILEPRLCAADVSEALDAKFVTMSQVPKKLQAGEVFYVAITMKNTGRQSWGPQNEKHAVLRSQEPADNTTWGTSIIIQGQGKNVPPGTEFKFHSWFMAPTNAGEYVFQWRLGQPTSDGGHTGPVKLFGESTPRLVIAVEKRAEEPAAIVPATAPGEQQVLTAADFEYAGSFKIPTRPDQDMPFSHSGLALRKMKDGSKRLFFNYTLPKCTLVELGIPPLVKLGEKPNTSSLKVAETKKVWGKLEVKTKSKGTDGRDSIWANGSFCWNENANTLYWTWWDPYYCETPAAVLGASQLGEDGTMTHLGAWKVEPGLYKWYWGGAITLPRAFADKYTGGHTLALGFGTGYSGTYADSHGPSLSVVTDPEPTKQTVSATHLLGYYKGESAPRDGLYFIGTNEGRDSWIGKQPDSPTKGYYTCSDLVRNGIFIDTPRKHGFIAFVHLQLGRIGYDYGSGTSGGAVHCWYCYDPKELGAVAQGRSKPGQPMPRARTNVPFPGGTGGFITGSCFDEDTGLLYLYNVQGHGCIHAYRLK